MSQYSWAEMTLATLEDCPLSDQYLLQRAWFFDRVLFSPLWTLRGRLLLYHKIDQIRKRGIEIR